MNLRRRLTLNSTLIASGAAALVLASILVLTFRADVRESRQVAQTVAQFLGGYAVSAITQNDAGIIAEAMGALGSLDAVARAEILLSDGSVFARYGGMSAGRERDASFTQEVRRPVTVGNRQLGTTVVEMSTQRAYNRLWRHTLLGSTLWLLVTGLACALVWRQSRRVTQPLGELIELTMRVATEESYSHRWEGDDAYEIGLLGRALNRLLRETGNREDRLREAIRRLETACHEAEDEARAKGDLIRLAVNRLRTPLSGATGTFALLKDTDLNDDQMSYVDAIERSVDRAGSVIDDLLDLIKIESGRMEIHSHSFSLSDLLQSVVALKERRALRTGLQLTMDLDARLPTDILGDSGRLKQILIKLIDAVIDATAQGRVRLEVFPDIRQEGTRVAFTVTAGDGGAIKSSSAIQQPSGSTGLELTICQRLIELMGGRLTSKSSENVGAVFRFDIPLKTSVINPFLGQSSAESDRERAVELSRSPEGGTLDPPNEFWNARILVAEDMDVNQFIIREQLTSIGIAADIVDNGLRAVEAFEKVAYDLVLMDIHMPEMDGIEATRKMRELQQMAGINPGCVMVGLSAQAQSGEWQQYMSEGFDDFVTKPIHVDNLRRVLARHLHRANDLVVWR